MKKGQLFLESIFPVIFFFLLSYWFLGANLFEGEIVAPMDLLLQYPGWQESGLRFSLVNIERSDILDGLLPHWKVIKKAVWEGSLPLWNPLSAGGQPGFPLLPDAYITPRFLLFLLFDDGLGFTLGLLVQLALTGLGAYVLCRVGVGLVPALFGGCTYMMCGFNASWLMWPHTATSLWIPWVLWALVRFVEAPSGRRGTILAGCVAALVWGGFPSVGAYGLYVAGLLMMWLVGCTMRAGTTVGEGFRLSLWVGALVGLGFLLAGMQLIPFAHFLQQFNLSYRGGIGGVEVSALSLFWDPFQYRSPPPVETTGYTGRIALGLALLALPLAWFRKRRWGSLSPWFWTAIALLSLVIVLKVPASLALLLYKLPVLYTNPVNRVLVIYGLAIAVLSAVSLQMILSGIEVRIHNRGGPVWIGRAAAIALGVIILGGQAFDISRVGRAQNAVVPKETFLPQTPTLEYVKKQLQPGQSVIGTSDAYMIPGTLGSYGLPEWFAHAFHKVQEKKVLANVVKDAWLMSPTAAVFSYLQIDFQSPWIDALGIRFVLTTHGPPLFGQERHDKASPTMPTHILGQAVHLQTSTVIDRVQVKLATYHRPSAGSDVWLTWLGADNRVLAESRVAGETIHDNSWVTFGFGKPLNLSAGRYQFQLAIREDRDALPVTAWAWTASDEFPAGYRTVDGKRVAGDLAFRIVGEPPRGWRVATPGQRVAIFERDDSPPGAYLVKWDGLDREPTLENLRWDTVELLENSPNHQVFRVQTEEPGWLVKTGRSWPGWEAYVDGQPVEIRTYQDILPAVPVDAGISEVKWLYNPLSWKIGLGVSGAGLGILAWLVGSRRLNQGRRKRESPTLE